VAGTPATAAVAVVVAGRGVPLGGGHRRGWGDLGRGAVGVGGGPSAGLAHRGWLDDAAGDAELGAQARQGRAALGGGGGVVLLRGGGFGGVATPGARAFPWMALGVSPWAADPADGGVLEVTLQCVQVARCAGLSWYGGRWTHNRSCT